MLRKVLQLLTEVTDWSIVAQAEMLSLDLNQLLVILWDQARGDLEGGEENLREMEAIVNLPGTVLDGSRDNVSRSGEGLSLEGLGSNHQREDREYLMFPPVTVWIGLVCDHVL